MLPARRISWIKAARRDFDEFPPQARDDAADALELAARGLKAKIAKPMKGLGSGVLEIAIKHRGDAFRIVYALVVAEDVWVIHAFQKKSTSGIATPKVEIDLIRQRLIRLKEMLG